MNNHILSLLVLIFIIPTSYAKENWSEVVNLASKGDPVIVSIGENSDIRTLQAITIKDAPKHLEPGKYLVYNCFGVVYTVKLDKVDLPVKNPSVWDWARNQVKLGQEVIIGVNVKKQGVIYCYDAPKSVKDGVYRCFLKDGEPHMQKIEVQSENVQTYKPLLQRPILPLFNNSYYLDSGCFRGK